MARGRADAGELTPMSSNSSVRVPLVMTVTPASPAEANPAPAASAHDHSRDRLSGGARAETDPIVREALYAIVREIDRVLGEGPTSTTESRLRAWLATPGLRALVYPPGSKR